ncbi:MAG: transcriptional regulator NrdR [Eubacteriales bacterium]|nr:transcriptional regulator NrdR [Eubacteriales bacterium]
MKCIYCGCLDDKVIDSRVSDDGTSIRRRRECLGCGKRYTTYETVETTPIMVVKKSGCRQQFSTAKVKQGIVKACEKRPVSMSDIDKLVNDIEMKIHNNFDGEVTTSQIGEYVMEGLKELDDVAYVRFAAIYRQFKDINSWLSEIQEVLKTKK